MKAIDLQVVKNTGREYRLSRDNPVSYKELIVKYGSTEITAYYTADISIQEDSLIRVGEYGITTCWYDFSRCALVLDDISFIDEVVFEVTDDLIVKLSGSLIKPKNIIKTVGISKKRVFSSPLRLDNGRGKVFSVLLVGFNRLADELYALDNNSEIVVWGKLHYAKTTNDYEIHLVKIKKGVNQNERHVDRSVLQLET